ncbi:hypothetical protein MRB53_010682 [Persea americana]|uniref:Uncharacterized protein n=1 Tax=Persea americana TaxID=3435 RepID=A0ACC2LSP8_PERAE|nr:hypothetical protein MRB53_010682 [Persea americana]
MKLLAEATEDPDLQHSIPAKSHSGIAPHRREAALPVPLVTGKLLESSPRVAGVRVAVAVLVRRWSGSVSGTRTRGSRQVKKGCPFSRHLRTVAAC